MQGNGSGDALQQSPAGAGVQATFLQARARPSVGFEFGRGGIPVGVAPGLEVVEGEMRQFVRQDKIEFGGRFDLLEQGVVDAQHAAGVHVRYGSRPLHQVEPHAFATLGVQGAQAAQDARFGPGIPHPLG